MHSSSFHLGFACVWDSKPENTWSGTPHHLFCALEDLFQKSLLDFRITNVDCALPQQYKRFYQMLGMGFHEGKHVSRYRFLPQYLKAVEKRCVELVRRVNQEMQSVRLEASLQAPLGAMLQIGDIAAFPDIPTFTYQDVTAHYLFQTLHTKGLSVPMFTQYREKDLLRRWEIQARYYEQCAGIFTMSHWLRNYLIDNGLADADKVHTVHAGTNVPLPSDIPPRKAPLHKKTILFIGRDFQRKGGDIVVQAFLRLQKQLPNSLRLVIAGPKRWEDCAIGFAGVPEGIEFLGDADYQTLRRYLSEADVFCMPSRFEAFGIVFAEALAFGVPCIGRNCYAMPEMIVHGQNGYLLEETLEGSEAASSLAELLMNTLENNPMKMLVEKQRSATTAYYSWNRVATQMLGEMV